jgi:hypothetical protein
MPPGAEQRLLDDVLGSLAVTVEQPPHVAEQRRRVLRIERADQLLVAKLRTAHTD